MMTIVVLGSNGMLGKEVVKSFNKTFFCAPMGTEVDITDRRVLFKDLEKAQPDAIVLAAAKTNVDEAEKEKEMYFLVNALGPRNVSEFCKLNGTTLIFISTDYVFPSRDEGLFVETDPPSPLNTYGWTKLEGESCVEKLDKFYILRTSSLYGFGKPNFALATLERISSLKEKNEEKVKVAKDLFCSPTYVRMFAEAILTLMEKKPAYGIYHVCGKGYCTRSQFAEKMCSLLGIAPSKVLEPIPIASFNLPAKRPLRALLSTEKWERFVGPLPSWEDGLKQFLMDHKKAGQKGEGAF